jgi:hypothetical protein
MGDLRKHNALFGEANMKKTLITLTAVAAMGFGSLAMAGQAQGPVMMTDTQLDTVVAGKTMDIFWDAEGGDLGTGAYVLKPANGANGGTDHTNGEEGGGSWTDIEMTCETQRGGCSAFIAGLPFPYVAP